MNRVLEGVTEKNTITTNDFVRALSLQCLESESCARPLSSDAVMGMFTDHGWTDSISSLNGWTGRISSLNEIPDAIEVFKGLAAYTDPDDFEFILTQEGDHIRSRVVSVVGDYLEGAGRSLYLPRRLLAVTGDNDFGGFTREEIAELSELVDDPMASELEFQRFFERHTHFFRKWDVREVYPQVYLTTSTGALIPDFILTDVETQRAFVVELKLPRPRLVVGEDNRRRFASAIVEARAQLLRYRGWFRQDANRERFYQSTGAMVYEPRLAVIVGRLSSFQTPLEHQMVTADSPDIEVVTYDEMLTYGRRRLRRT
jgi:hypothetical protein